MTMQSALAAVESIRAKKGRGWSVPLLWLGEPVFIVAGGTSVAGVDVDLLRGRRVIVVNSSYQSLPWADLLFFSDAIWWLTHRRRLESFGGMIVTTMTELNSPCLRKLKNTDRPLDRQRRRPIALSDDPAAVAMRFTSLAPATNIAHMLNGGAPIVWLGADGRLGADGASHHHAPHRGWRFDAMRWERHHDDLDAIAAGLRMRGVTLINASPGSAWGDLAPVMTLREAIDCVGAGQLD